MEQRYNLSHASLFIWTILVIVGLGYGFLGCRQESGSVAKKESAERSAQQEQELLKLRVDPGDAGPALKYYADTLEELGLKNWTTLPTDPNNGLAELAKLQNLELALEFMGYKDLVPSDLNKNLENLPSNELMKLYPDDILASAFFAPKITDVSGKDPLKINVGWRKVVYLKARKASRAAEKGIEAGLLLFNKFQGPGKWNEDPIKPRPDKSNESLTTQFILTRANGKPLKFPCYFLVYARLSEGGKLRATLDASFDARAPEFQPTRPYYVPNSCAQCHGAETGPKQYDLNKVKLNFLDTDHWFDRVQTGDDFAFIEATPFGVLYDGGKDETSAQFKAAFEVLRQINSKIRDQNEQVDAGVPPSVQLRAARKWFELHATDTGHKDVFQRAVPPSKPGEQIWQANATPDKDLLPQLNRYCYRCHSSVRFNIFDRPAVVSKKLGIDIRLNSSNKDIYMPQDRELSSATKKALADLVKALK